MSSYAKALAIAVFLILLGLTGWLVFYGPAYGEPKELHFAASEKMLTIAYAEETATLEPTNFETVTRQRLLQMYEPLVRLDRDLRPEPALAISWGRLDPLTWEFRLRPDVKFHNGKMLEEDDVLASFDRAKKFGPSQLKGFLQGISFSAEQGRIRMKTEHPDPLLINKIATVLITPKAFDPKIPIGTGPYAFSSFQPNRFIMFERFPNYWGKIPYFRYLKIVAIPKQEDRIAALKSGKIDLLVNVPPLSGASSAKDFEVRAMPNLEISFLLFNHRSLLFSRREIREAVAYHIDVKKFIDLSMGFAAEATQFTGNGVFGFHPKLKKRAYDVPKAHELLGEQSDLPAVRLYLAKGLENFGAYIVAELQHLGLNVDARYVTPAEVIEQVKKGGADLYFLGFRAELGDSADLYHTLVESRAPFNGGNYSSETVDRLIQQSDTTLDQKSRLTILQKIMKILVEEDIYGIPLFESEVIYGSSKPINFTPRIDGYVFAHEISAP